MKPVRGGDLRHVVTVQSYTDGAPDALGQPVRSWAALYTGIRAAIWPLTGREYLAAQSINSKIDCKIRIRYHAGIYSKNRVIWGARTFEIATVIQPEMRPIYLDLLCYEIHAGATKTTPHLPSPTVTSITPATAINSASLTATIAGTGFVSGMTVKLTKTGQSDISATITTLADNSAVCVFPITGAAAGQWNVIVTNVDGLAGTLTNGLTISAV